MHDFEKTIIETLSYFDLFDYPLTGEELFRYLIYTDKNTDCTDCDRLHRSRIAQISTDCNRLHRSQMVADYAEFLGQLQQLEQLQHIEHLEHLKHVEHKQGFWFLKGRGGIIAERQRRVKLIDEKMKVAVRGIKKLRWIPFVRSVFACNTVASAVAQGDSDIDVFIVIRKKRMWLARMLVTLTLSLFGLRRTKKKIKNKICLSFYVTDDNLNIENISIEDPDIYLVYWLAQLIPLYDRDGLFESIQKANSWVKKYSPNAFQPYDLLHRFKVEDTKLSKRVKNIFERMWGGQYGNMIEKQAKGIQLSKMKRNFHSAKNKNDSRVIISDSMLKFHENDRREEYRELWQAKCRDFKMDISRILKETRN